MRSLADNLFDYIAAGYSGLWVESHEHEEACEEIRQLCEDNGWSYVQWDCAAGMAKTFQGDSGEWRLLRSELAPIQGQGGPAAEVIRPQGSGSRPQVNFDAAIRAVNVANYGPDGSPTLDEEGEQVYGIVVVKNIHAFLTPMPIKQLILNTLREARANRQVLIGLSHTNDIPQELEKVFQILEHPLPNREQLLEIAQEIAVEEGEMPEDGEDRERLIDAAAGLTRIEAENAFSLSLVRHGTLLPQEVFEIKAETLRQLGGALTLYRGKERFADVGGMAYLKEFCLDCLSHRESDPRFRARGILLTGVTGAGKTYTAQILGNEVGRPVLLLDVGALLDKHVGQSGANLRRALRRAEFMAPCVLVINEVEKALAGVASSGKTDSGVKADMFGYMLDWLEKCEADVYTVVTSNDITKITDHNPEFARAGRFDGTFFVDFPGREAKDAIWEIQLRRYGFLEPDQSLADLDQELPDDTDMVGAEIQGICRLARLRRKPLVRIGRTALRVVQQSAETIEATREWATGCCWSTEYEEIYDKDQHHKRLAEAVSASGKARRKVARRRTVAS